MWGETKKLFLKAGCDAGLDPGLAGREEGGGRGKNIKGRIGLIDES